MSDQEILDKPAEVAEYRPADAGIAALRDKAAKTVYDVTTTVGYKTARAIIAEAVSIRTSIEAIRKEQKAPLLARGKLLDDEAKRLTSLVVAIEEPIKTEVQAEDARRDAIKAAKEAADLARQQAIQARLTALGQYVMQAVGKDSAGIAAILATVAELPMGVELYEHRTGEAMELQAEVAAKLEHMRDAVLAQEQEAARLAAERAEQERVRKEQEAAAKAQREAEEARMAAERAKLAEEQAALKAAQDAENARQEAARAEQARKDAEAAAALRRQQEEAAAALQAEQDKLAEQRRQFEEQQAAAAQAEQDRLDAIAREEQEKAEAAARAEQEKADAAEQALREKAEAEQRAADEAEQERLAEAARREQEQFSINGPGDVEMVRVLADHYDAPVGDVMQWLKKFDYTATDEALAAANAQH